MTEKQAAELLEYVRQGMEFGKEQAPLLVEEVLRYGWVQSWVSLGGACLLFLIAVAGIYAVVKADEEWITGVGLLSSLVGVGVGIPMSCFSIQSLLQLHYAPRLYILEKLAGMVGGQ